MNRLQLISSRISSKIPQYTKLTVYFQGQVGYISMHSSKDLNALSPTMIYELQHAFSQLNNDPQVNVIVVRSELNKIFCAGADIKEFAKPEFDYEFCVRYEPLHILNKRMEQVKKPIIAAVNGKAFGGGFELALLCDIIIATEKAQFGLPEIHLGLMPGMGGTQRFTKLVGQKKAMRYILTGEVIKAEQAYRLNIAEKASIQNFYTEVRNMGQKIGDKALTSVIIAKRSIKQGSNMTLNQGLEYERDVFYSMLNTKAAKQGVSAFVNKRAANFKGL